MSVSRGKDFEDVISTCFEKVPGVSIDRIHDQTTGYKGSKNICDFFAYKYPYAFYIECKAVHGNTLNFKSNIAKTQWDGLLEKSKIYGVYAGIICWFIDHDLTMFIPIGMLNNMRDTGAKSFNIRPFLMFVNDDGLGAFFIKGKKKRVFFDYDIGRFLEDLTNDD